MKTITELSNVLVNFILAGVVLRVYMDCISHDIRGITAS